MGLIPGTRSNSRNRLWLCCWYLVIRNYCSGNGRGTTSLRRVSYYITGKNNQWHSIRVDPESLECDAFHFHRLKIITLYISCLTQKRRYMYVEWYCKLFVSTAFIPCESSSWSRVNLPHRLEILILGAKNSSTLSKDV